MKTDIVLVLTSDLTDLTDLRSASALILKDTDKIFHKMNKNDKVGGIC